MTILPYSLGEQVTAMRRDWPDFRASLRGFRQERALWIGHVTPQFQCYRLEIEYNLGMVIQGPNVRVTSPQLSRLPGNQEGSLPHVYNVGEDPTLCLFDPDAEEWSGWMLISQTIVPWAIDWLACYEWWLMTGVWHGGGRHRGTPSIRTILETSR
ncbi:hypothetical protein FHS20_004046 [Phyllobacterium endophyticum]|uniref:Type II CBASS E2 protein domain-containing protein n=1 Tax=Phyllobacterium endophyticum TaxID=1149773 RepID=A0A2P7AKA8_9HYPH|nr:hypothetical protein [Phyllobacterium endophyticum]PSH54627.1 hypothetical protein CU100_25960 [Phyllobacterium endophyticum]TYR40606.1 hypothetical protein FY050_16990 [Phyllobacterium endophyticum]